MLRAVFALKATFICNHFIVLVAKYVWKETKSTLKCFHLKSTSVFFFHPSSSLESIEALKALKQDHACHARPYVQSYTALHGITRPYTVLFIITRPYKGKQCQIYSTWPHKATIRPYMQGPIMLCVRRT